MFDSLEMAPPDAILGLTEAFNNDPNPGKINLGVGVYKDAANKTPVLESVKHAEALVQQGQTTKTYMPIPGSPDYTTRVRELLFGKRHEVLESERAATAHTPGGTGALRVAGDFIHGMFPGARIWLSDPTWQNHRAVFQAAGLDVRAYPYYDSQGKTLAFDAMMAALAEVPEGDVVLFHGCCHNPSGMDPDPGQWADIAALVRKRRLLPLLDFAYQGLADGLEADAAGLRTFCMPGSELMVCSSFSKNFGLYCERTGALTVVGASAATANKALSQVKRCIRANYSNPPAHGAAIVSTILGDAALQRLWEQELGAMRGRINTMRRLFVETLQSKGVATDFSFITRQKGMFSFSGLSPNQVKTLREKYAIYIVASGRINVAGMTEENMDRLCTAIAAVL